MTKEKLILSATQKALRINLDTSIYGSMVEIGAGQEVARQFFRAGSASGTIAKTMSAYDRNFSDAIYGKEEHGRYVCKARNPECNNCVVNDLCLFNNKLLRRNNATI